MKTVSPNVRCNVAMRSSNSPARSGRARGRLVEEEDFRVERERAGERGALDHAAREFGGQLVAGIGLQPDHFDLQHRQLVEQAVREVQILAHRDLDVLLDGQRGEQRPLLEQHAPAPFNRAPRRGREPVEALAKDLDGAGALRHEPEDGAGQNRLAHPGGTDEAQNLAAVDVEVETVEDGALAETDLDPADPDHGFAVQLRGKVGATVEHGAGALDQPRKCG
jgi:hypothetical protein